LPDVTKGIKKTFCGYASPAVFTSKIRKQKNTFYIDPFLFLIVFRPFQLIACKAECRLTASPSPPEREQAPPLFGGGWEGMRTAFVSQAGYLSDAVDVKKQMLSELRLKRVLFVLVSKSKDRSPRDTALIFGYFCIKTKVRRHVKK